MAYPNSLLLLALIISAASVAQGAIIDGLQIAELNVAGRLVCAIGGTDNNSQGLPNVHLQLLCNGGRTNLGQVLTNATGFFDFVVKLADGVVFDASTCVVSGILADVTCNVFPRTGTLRAPLVLLNIVQNAVGAIANFVVGVFVFAACDFDIHNMPLHGLHPRPDVTCELFFLRPSQ